MVAYLGHVVYPEVEISSAFRLVVDTTVSIFPVMRDEKEKTYPSQFDSAENTRKRLSVRSGRFEIFRRPSQNYPRFLPLRVRSAGRGRFFPGEIDGQKTHDYLKLIWCCSGSGAVYPAGTRQQLKKDQVMLYLPGQRHLSHAEDDEWSICFLTVDGDAATAYLKGFGLEAGGIFDAGTFPEATFRSLFKAIKEIGPAGAVHASVIAYDILSSIRNRHAAPFSDQLVSQAISIFEEEWASSVIGIDVVAIRLNSHRSSLSRRFRKAVGITPSTYLNGLRMQHALALIEYTREPIVDIARSCGYQDPSYFSRLFRQVNGVTARRHREIFQNAEPIT